jgi:prepilin-type N-terminal cleavage/methylation domain-containing protein
MKSNSQPLRAPSDVNPRSAQLSRVGLYFLARKGQAGGSGFTLIESLVAIIILSLTVVSVLPPIFWATATRVQNRRAEQAVQLAQSEIDRVRVAVERNSVTQAQLPPKVGTGLKPDAPAPATVIPESAKLRSAVPGCNRDDGNQAINATDLILVDTDPETSGGCKPEFMIQTFRGSGVPKDTVDTVPGGFVMGVRVYSIVARGNVGAGIQKEAGTLRGSQGLGTQQFKPLAVQYSTIVRTNDSDSLDTYRKLCAVTGANAACVPVAAPAP